MDCCETESSKLIDSTSIKTPIKNILAHTNELKLANHKVDELEELIQEQEWKLTQNAKTHQLSLIANAGSVTLGLLICILLRCCCKSVGIVDLELLEHARNLTAAQP
jgi:hypothetical protein